MITVKIAQTLDGKIATSTGESKWITSQATRRFARNKRNDFDAILVGINTVLADDPKLTPATQKKGFKRIICDSTLRLPLNAKVISSANPNDCIVVTTRKSASARRKRLMNSGVDVWVAPMARPRGVKLEWVVSKLKDIGVHNLLIEGGAHIVSRALRANLVDHMHIYIAPKIIGDDRARASLVDFNIKSMAKVKEVKIKNVQTINKDIFIQADVYRNR